MVCCLHILQSAIVIIIRIESKRVRKKKRGEFTVDIFWCKLNEELYLLHIHTSTFFFSHLRLCWVSFFFWLIYLTAIPWGALCYNKDWGDLFSLSLSSACRIYCPWWFGPYDDCRRGVSILIKMLTKVRHPTYYQVPLVCITAYPKTYSVTASSFPKKMQRTGCFSSYMMTARTAYRDSHCHMTSVPKPCPWLWPSPSYSTILQLPQALNFSPGPHNELVKNDSQHAVLVPCCPCCSEISPETATLFVSGGIWHHSDRCCVTKGCFPNQQKWIKLLLTLLFSYTCALLFQLFLFICSSVELSAFLLYLPFWLRPFILQNIFLFFSFLSTAILFKACWEGHSPQTFTNEMNETHWYVTLTGRRSIIPWFTQTEASLWLAISRDARL